MPLLLDCQVLTVEALEVKETDRIGQMFHAIYRADKAAINACLAKLTGEKAPLGTPAERWAFWQEWFLKHAAEIPKARQAMR